jgi:hypothetical protein
LRALLTWFALHFFLLVFAGFASLRIPFTSVVLLAVVVGAVTFIDARRRNELLLVQNLGIAPSMVTGISVSTIIILEIGIRVLATTAGV